LGVADVEPNSRITDLLPRESQIAFRRVDSVDLEGVRALEDRLGERAGAAPEIQPSGSGRNREPIDELAGCEPAPPAHIGLIRPAARPNALFGGGDYCALQQTPRIKVPDTFSP